MKFTTDRHLLLRALDCLPYSPALLLNVAFNELTMTANRDDCVVEVGPLLVRDASDDLGRCRCDSRMLTRAVTNLGLEIVVEFESETVIVLSSPKSSFCVVLEML